MWNFCDRNVILSLVIATGFRRHLSRMRSNQHSDINSSTGIDIDVLFYFGALSRSRVSGYKEIITRLRIMVLIIWTTSLPTSDGYQSKQLASLFEEIGLELSGIHGNLNSSRTRTTD